MPDVFKLYEQFVAAYASGEDPDVMKYLTQAEPLADELAALIAAYLEHAPAVDSSGARARAASLVASAWESPAPASGMLDRLREAIAAGSAELAAILAQVRDLPGSLTISVPATRASGGSVDEMRPLRVADNPHAQAWLVRHAGATSLTVRGFSPEAEGMRPWLYASGRLISGDGPVSEESAVFPIAEEPHSETDLIVFVAPL